MRLLFFVISCAYSYWPFISGHQLISDNKLFRYKSKKFYQMAYISSSDVPGIKIICSTLSSSLTIHVMNISITGLQCREYVYNRHGNPIFRSGKTVQLLVHGMLIL